MEALGTVLMEIGTAVAYASKALTKVQANYGQNEEEILAIIFGYQKCHQFIYDKQIDAKTDHKSLVSILRKPITCVTLRIQRLLVKLQSY